MTRDEYAHQLIDRLAAPHTRHNAYALISWMQAEGGSAHFNPLNTTLEMPGDWSYNSVGVRNYVSAAQGLEATTKTLLNTKDAGYEPIVKHLRDSDGAAKTLKAVEDSKWGTGGLALACLPYVRADYWKFAGHTIAGS